MEWFSVSDKMPNPGDIVRVFDGNVAVTMGVNKDQIFVPFPGFPHVHNVTHWAYEPLPQPIVLYVTHQTAALTGGSIMQKSQQPLTEADWLFAYDHLNMVMAEYTYAGTSCVAMLYMKLTPLKERYDSGERTQELYDAITELK